MTTFLLLLFINKINTFLPLILLKLISVKKNDACKPFFYLVTKKLSR